MNDGTNTNSELIAAIRDEVARAVDLTKAAPMQAYMKSAMPYLGAQAPQMRRTYRAVFAAMAALTACRDVSCASL